MHHVLVPSARCCSCADALQIQTQSYTSSQHDTAAVHTWRVMAQVSGQNPYVYATTPPADREYQSGTYRSYVVASTPDGEHEKFAHTACCRRKHITCAFYNGLPDNRRACTNVMVLASAQCTVPRDCSSNVCRSKIMVHPTNTCIRLVSSLVSLTLVTSTGARHVCTRTQAAPESSSQQVDRFHS